MDLLSYNLAQKRMIEDLENREIYIYGIRVHHDPREHPEDMEVIINRVSDIISGGYGEYMRKVIFSGKMFDME